MLEKVLKGEILTVKTDLDNKIENVRSELKSDIKDLDNKIEINITKFDNTARLHNWMLGTIITITIGILLTLIFK
ncbi:hypothetical protein [Borrelia persica]|uniref:hypothetical protein n=1 Tax=Borrelia persica TaxID=44448 RepID=UPI00046758B0|nr:hypothetical protein [Borrelia persica]